MNNELLKRQSVSMKNMLTKMESKDSDTERWATKMAKLNRNTERDRAINFGLKYHTKIAKP